MAIGRGNMTKQLTGGTGMAKSPTKKMFMGGPLVGSAGPMPAPSPAAKLVGSAGPMPAPSPVAKLVGSAGPMAPRPVAKLVGSAGPMAPRAFKKGGKIDGAALRGKTKGTCC